jgi:YidC/Oxa1 family membrane protein insertase
MLLCYMVSGNYALALFLFTLVTRIALFPLSLKQHKEQAKMAVFKRSWIISSKNTATTNKNTTKRYRSFIRRKGTARSPDAAGDHSVPVLFGVIDVVYKPFIIFFA